MKANASDLEGASPQPKDCGIARAILVAGLIAGTLDISAAFISTYFFFGAGPAVVLRFISSGAFGHASFSGGVPMALVGLGFHFGIAFAWTTLFMFAARRAPALVRNLALAATGYGILVWLVMNLGVIPLSRIARGPFRPLQVALGILYLILFIALPNGIVARRFFKRHPERETRPAA
ncbi:MAG TPA: hypothetical protein VGF85_04165 [Opitutaceae bacterium]|jgi:hypothetical protein